MVHLDNPRLHDMTRSVSRSVVIDAPADQIFAVLADPRRHAEFDGSGSVKSTIKGPEQLVMGDRFGMRMKLGIPYVITNEVVEYAKDRLIGWRHLGHHVWRYELEPSGSSTKVTETFDWSTARSPKALELIKAPAKNALSIDKTLARLKTLLEKAS
jgi:uncharacterized protein YndB with AHSA1/START domain